MHRIRHLLIHVLCALVCVVPAVPVSAQVLPSLPKASPAAAPFGVKQEGLFLTAPVSVDGVSLFRIAAPVAPAGGELPINVRLLYVQNAISQLLAQKDGGGTIYDPASFKVSLDRVGSQETLVATDAKHTGESGEVPILTVTSADAQYANMPADLLANQWQPQLQTALIAALQKRQPQEIRHNVDALIQALIALVILTVAGIAGWILLRRRQTMLKKTIAERQERADHEHVASTAGATNGATAPEHQRKRLLALQLRAAGPEQRLRRVKAYSGFIVSALLLLWIATIIWALLLFPQTTTSGLIFRNSAVSVAVIWAVAYLVNKLGDLIIVPFAEAYSKRGLTSEDKARHMLRAPTISTALSGAKSFIVTFVALLAALSALNIPIASVVTIGGVAALAIGFAAQSLVRDFLNGMLVLFEDQYVVGDYIMIGDYNGIVETLSLRVVQIRDVRGNLITIPHSSVTQVVNASRNWSRVDFRIPIDTGADVSKAMTTLRSTIEELTKDPAWREVILQPVEWMGIENPSKNGLVLRASIRTAPLRQFELNRALNERVCAAFAEEGIPLGADPLGPAAPPVQGSPSPL